MTKIVLIKRGRGLVPADPVSEECIAGIKEGAQVMAEVSRPRSMKQLRFIHAALAEVIKHTDRFSDVEDLKRFLKLRSRMFRPVVMPDGSVILDVPSIKFEEMDQIIFQRVWARWRHVIVNEILVGVDPIMLQSTILEEIA